MKVSHYWYGVAVGVLALFASAANAETTAAGKTKFSTVKVDPDANKIVGFVDIRPGYIPTGQFLTENTVRLGYQFKKDRRLVVEQYISTNLYQPTSAASGMNVTQYDGYVGAQLNNLWTDKANGLSFSYAPRFYLPQSQLSQDRGLITFHRSNFALTKQFNGSFSLTLMEIPLLFLYENAGYVKNGTASANPIFQNRVYLIADVNITSKLKFSFPLMFFQTKHSDFQVGARNNGAWAHSVWIWPELDYSVNDKVTVGVAYYNMNNLIDADFHPQIGDGLRNGVFQGVFIYSI